MKVIATLLLFISFTSFNTTDTEVYICVSKGAKKYHLDKDCRGLSGCKHEIKKVTKNDATNKGLILCGWED